PHNQTGFQRVTIGGPGGEPGWLGIRKLDDHTLAFALRHPFPDFFVESLSVRVLPRATWAKHLDVLTGTGDHLTWDLGYDQSTGEAPGAIGSGPYRMGKWFKAKSVRLERSEEFHDWTQLPRVDERGRIVQPESPAYDPAWTTNRHLARPAALEFSIYLTTESAALALQQENVDAVAWPIPPSIINDLKSGDKCTSLAGEKVNCGTVIGLDVTRQQGFNYLGFNLRRLPMGYDRWDPKNASSMADVGKAFRKAVAYSTDKETIVSQAIQGHGIVAHGPVTPDLVEWYNTSLIRYPFNESAATGELDAAGWARDPSCPKIGNPPDFARKLPGIGCGWVEILAPEAAYDPVCAVFWQMIEAAAQKVGLNVKSVPTAQGKIEDSLEKGAFQMYGKLCRSFPGDVGRRMGAFLRSFYFCGGEERGNIAGYCDPKVDALLGEYDLTSNRSRRVQIVKDVQGIVMEDVALNPLFFRFATEAYRKDRFVVPALSPPGWIHSVDGIMNRWSLLLVDHPALPTKIAASVSGQAVCGQLFYFDVLFASDGSPIAGASVNASAQPPVRVVSALPVMTDTGGRARLKFAVDDDAVPGSASIEFEVTKPGYLTQRHLTEVPVSCLRPYGIAIQESIVTPWCVVPGEPASIRFTVVDVEKTGLPIEGATVSVVFVEAGTVEPGEQATDSSGRATFGFVYPESLSLSGSREIEIRAEANSTKSGIDYWAPEISLNVTVDPGGCGRSPPATDSGSYTGIAIAVIGAGVALLVLLLLMVRKVQKGAYRPASRARSSRVGKGP
ncbi:MAG TPA: ABC transporter substrate-binding protein, partial [Thermoplasmata archaeon]|nr:ABC transporter substrate-binding protein [Thermoplasmata archaeon]